MYSNVSDPYKNLSFRIALGIIIQFKWQPNERHPWVNCYYLSIVINFEANEPT